MASDSGEKGSLDCITPNTSLPVLPVLSSSSSYTRTDIQLFTLLNRLPLPIRLRAGRKGLCDLLNLICPSVCVCAYGCTRRVRTAHVHLSHFTSPNSHADRNSNPGPFRFPLQRANRRRPCSLHLIIIIACVFIFQVEIARPFLRAQHSLRTLCRRTRRLSRNFSRTLGQLPRMSQRPPVQRRRRFDKSQRPRQDHRRRRIIHLDGRRPGKQQPSLLFYCA